MGANHLEVAAASALAARRVVTVGVHTGDCNGAWVNPERGGLRSDDGLRHRGSIWVVRHFVRINVAVCQSVRVAEGIHIGVINIQCEATGQPSSAAADFAVTIGVHTLQLDLRRRDAQAVRNRLAERGEHSHGIRVRSRLARGDEAIVKRTWNAVNQRSSILIRNR